MRSNKGFTVIELLIVVAIILIIAAIAYPNMVQSYTIVNEAEAVATLRKYASAQNEFRKNSYAGGGYADNFRNLYYASAPGSDENLKLVPRQFADAPARENSGGAPTAADRETPGEAKAFQGYFFREPPNYSGAENNGKFRDGFALLALPADSSRGGRHAFWIDAEEHVWAYSLPEGLKYVPGGETVAGMDDLDTPDMGPAAQAKWEIR